MKRALRTVCILSLIFGIVGIAGMLTVEVSKDLSSVMSVQKAVAEQTDIVYHGNVSSKIFHGPDCRWYNCKNCTAVFKSREEAIEAGYRPCKICKP